MKFYFFLKLDVFSKYKLNMNHVTGFISEWVKNIVGKKENAGFQHFLLFLQCFKKASLCHCVEKS